MSSTRKIFAFLVTTGLLSMGTTVLVANDHDHNPEPYVGSGSSMTYYPQSSVSHVAPVTSIERGHRN